ncbi:MAG TPA: hypothetical protein ENJ66_02025 [Calditrichae bacterium]|nr:hypothetical protein [Calditrichia bacterium]
MKCPLCGYEFDHGNNSRCTTCPLNHGCQIVCCPNCGYEMPPESRTVVFLKRVFSRKREKHGQTTS